MHGFKSIRFLMRCGYLELPGDARWGNIANKAGSRNLRIGLKPKLTIPTWRAEGSHLIPKDF